MSWHYSRELEEGFYLPTYLDGTPSAEWRWRDTPERFSSNGSETESSNPSPSGTTLEPSTGDHGEVTLMSSPEGSPAKTSPQRVKVEDLPESVQVFGSRCSESLTRYGLALSSRKTVRTYVPVDSAPSSKDLTAWGTLDQGGEKGSPPAQPRGNCEVSDSNKTGLQGQRKESSGTEEELQNPRLPRWWLSEPSVGRVAHGVASRVDRIKALGNGQVPAVARAAWHLLSETH